MTIREITIEEINEVAGGNNGANIAMGIAGGWASTVAGFAIGGPLGAAVGFGLGSAVSTGLVLSGGSFGSMGSFAGGCRPGIAGCPR